MSEDATPGPVPGQPNLNQSQPAQTFQVTLPGLFPGPQPQVAPTVPGPFDTVIEIGAFPGTVQIMFKSGNTWVRIPCHLVNALIAQIEGARDAAAMMASVSTQGTAAMPSKRPPPPREKGDA